MIGQCLNYDQIEKRKKYPVIGVIFVLNDLTCISLDITGDFPEFLDDIEYQLSEFGEINICRSEYLSDKDRNRIVKAEEKKKDDEEEET